MASHPVKFFTNIMAGAPILSNNWGDLNGVLHACLVTGFNLKTVDSLTCTAGVATASMSSGHGFTTDQIITIAGCEQLAYNGEHRVKTVTSATLTFDLTGSPVSPATSAGNISCKVAPLGWERAFTGSNKAAYRSINPVSPRHFLRVDDGVKPNNGFGAYGGGWAKWANVGICESMTDIDTILGAQAPYNPNSPNFNWGQTAVNQFGWYKWTYARQIGYEDYGDGGAGARSWVIVGDDRAFYLMNTVQAGFNWGGRGVYGFGDLPSFKPGDAYATFLKAQDLSNSQQYHSYPFEHGCDGIVRSLGVGGTALLKDYTQLGNYVRWGVGSLNTNNAEQFMGRGGIPFPNGPDYALWLLPAYVRQESAHMRGTLPGVRWIPQDRPYGDLTVVENVQNEPGKRFALVNYAVPTEYGQIAFDITGPWR
jgi:hypothetical protein